MPALITHYLHAKQVFSPFASTLSRPAFLLGAQGPDYLYFHRALPLFWHGKSLREIGTLLHNIPANKLFSCFAEYCHKYNDTTALSYACGFLCHYVLDSVCHPFIYAKQRKIIEQNNIKYFDGYVHSKIEHSLDVIMLNRLENISGNCFNYDDALSDEAETLKSCAKIATYSVNEFAAEMVTEKQILQAFSDLRALQRFSKDRYHIKHALLRGLERICFYPESLSTFVRTSTIDESIDFANDMHEQWQNPYLDNAENDMQNSSFDELFDKSIDLARELVVKFTEAVKSGVTTIDFTGNYSYKTGLAIENDAETDNTYDKNREDNE